MPRIGALKSAPDARRLVHHWDRSSASVGEAVRPSHVDIGASEEDLEDKGELIQILLTASDRSLHIGAAPSSGPGSEFMSRLIEKTHLGIDEPTNYHKGIHVSRPDNLGSQKQDKKEFTFVSWNPGALTRHRQDADRQVRFVLNHEIAVLQEADREGQFVIGAYQNTSSSTSAGHMSGLTQIQSAKGICCSCEVWSPEHARAGQLYRAFMHTSLSEALCESPRRHAP